MSMDIYKRTTEYFSSKKRMQFETIYVFIKALITCLTYVVVSYNLNVVWNPCLHILEAKYSLSN